MSVDNKTFTKDMLKDGMVVKLRNKELYYVLGDKLIGKYGFNVINKSNYHYDLIKRVGNDKDYDVMSVYTIDDSSYKLSCFLDEQYLTLVWKRKEENPLELTMEDIESKYGCKVKIVNK